MAALIDPMVARELSASQRATLRGLWHEIDRKFDPREVLTSDAAKRAAARETWIRRRFARDARVTP